MKTTTKLLVVAAAEKNTSHLYIFLSFAFIFIYGGSGGISLSAGGRGEDRDSRYKVHPKLVVLSPAIVIFSSFENIKSNNTMLLGWEMNVRAEILLGLV